jgi:hypothetical protein
MSIAVLRAAISQLAGAVCEHAVYASTLTLALLGVWIVLPRMKCQFAILLAAESQLAGAVGEHAAYASTLALTST